MANVLPKDAPRRVDNAIPSGRADVSCRSSILEPVRLLSRSFLEDSVEELVSVVGQQSVVFPEQGRGLTS